MRAGELPVIEELIKNGADINLSDSTGFSPLIEAAWFGKFPVIKTLLESGASMENVNAGGNTALMEAAAMGHIDIVNELILSGADLTRVNNSGQSVYDISKNPGIRLLLPGGKSRLFRNFFIHLKKIAGKFIK